MTLPHGGAHCGPDVPPYFSRFVDGRRGEVLDAALCVFAERGYSGGTMREIATRLGVTEPALYRHYPSKEALFADLVALAGDQVVSQGDAMLERVNPGNLRESLLELIAMRRPVPGEPTSKPIVGTLMMAAPHDAAFQETFRAHLARPMIARLEALVPTVDASFGIERRAEDLGGRVRAFMSLYVGYFVTSMVFDAPSDDAAIVDAMLAVMGWDA
jgi:AcrR family transcriptional regulator